MIWKIPVFVNDKTLSQNLNPNGAKTVFYQAAFAKGRIVSKVIFI